MKNLLVVFLFPFVIISCQSRYPGIPESYKPMLDIALQNAGDNATELLRALDLCPDNQKEGMAFLIAYMPQRDLSSLSASFLLENAQYAYLVRKKYNWCRDLPDSIFFNEVLPYANITEERDPWRKELFELFSPLVDSSENTVNAVFDICRPINKITGVEYNTNRSKVDLSPKESMAEGMATCTGLSILLTDAFRSVGIPSRLAGTPMWTNYRGNHTWSEVWIDGEWKFIEYYPDTLNKSWFLADAGKADPDNMLHWIYAVSYKPTGLPFYAVNMVSHLIGKVDMGDLPKEIQQYWDGEMEEEEGEPYIHGVNVTQRYIDLYESSLLINPLKDEEVMIEMAVYNDIEKRSSDSRHSCRIEIYRGEELLDFGYSPGKKDDLNQFLTFRLKKNTAYEVKIMPKGSKLIQLEKITTDEENRQEFHFFLQKDEGKE